MTRPALFDSALAGMLAGPLGSDVAFGTVETRGILNAEWREQDTGNGLTQQVWSTILTVQDGILPDTCREGATITVDAVDYLVRKRARADDLGAREYILGPAGS